MGKAKFQKISDERYRSICPCGRIHEIYNEDGDVVCDVITPKKDDDVEPQPGSEPKKKGLPVLFGKRSAE